MPEKMKKQFTLSQKTIRKFFTPRELYAMWAAVCAGTAYEEPYIFSNRLKYKLYDLLTDEERESARKKYEISESP